MGENIEKVWLPQCLEMDIPYDEIEHLNPRRIRQIAKAFQHKQEEKRATINYTSWLNGIYISKAISACFSKDAHYPQIPIDLTRKNERTMKEKLELWALAVNAEYDRKHPESQ